MEKQVEALVKKAGEAHSAEDAMKFSQAACNMAHVIRTLAQAKYEIAQTALLRAEAGKAS